MKHRISVNEGIELHDSELIAITFSGGEPILSLAPAYIHRSSGNPGVDPGSGWLQPATVTLSDALVLHTPSQLPAIISDGHLRIGSAQHRNVIPANGLFIGAIELRLDLVTGETLIIRGHRVSIRLHGEPAFVESFHP